MRNSKFCKVELLYPLCQKHWFNKQFNKTGKWLKKEITFEIKKFFIFSNSKKNLLFFNDNYTNKEKEIRQHDIKISIMLLLLYKFLWIIVYVINLRK